MTRRGRSVSRRRAARARTRVARRTGRQLVQRVIAALCLLLLIGWCGGFLWFLYVTYSPSVAPARADGIVVLTGGEDRLATAFQMLNEGHADQLLISGVPAAVTLRDVERSAHLAKPPAATHVTLGHHAQTTVGNADETAAWVRAHHIRSLIVVTAGYHMPRAVLELSRAMPDVQLYPMRVQPAAIFDGTRLHVWRLLLGEYTKWLLAELRFARLVGFLRGINNP
ncbi:MAG TPA: YdcF family protein [Acidisoma sp.]|uniref:YdcF family protein n=1 Tax=Acidisoma sp. TaxID=1872115 RepID=UPI002B8C39BE|nr:YdcF family protein [Acidisoma sp.]HTI01866.1 YdcF family protein [Acidisoma sp.]